MHLYVRQHVQGGHLNSQGLGDLLLHCVQPVENMETFLKEYSSVNFPTTYHSTLDFKCVFLIYLSGGTGFALYLGLNLGLQVIFTFSPQN